MEVIQGGKPRPKRAIYCPGPGRWVTLGAYVAAVKVAKQGPEVLFPCGLTSWWPTTGAEVLRQFWRGVEDRINEARPAIDRGRELPLVRLGRAPRRR